MKKNFIQGGTSGFGSGVAAPLGTGALYHCEGGGPGTVKILTSTIKTLTAKFSGGAIFMKMTEDIYLELDQVSTSDS
jgi:hypothetical protein